MLCMAALSRVHRGEGSHLLQSPFSCDVLWARDTGTKKTHSQGRQRNVKGKKKVHPEMCVTQQAWVPSCSVARCLSWRQTSTGLQWVAPGPGTVGENTWRTCKLRNDFHTVRVSEDSTGGCNKPETKIPAAWAEETNPEVGVGFEFYMDWKEGTMWQESYMSGCWGVPVVPKSNPKLSKGTWLQQTVFS